MASTLTDRMNIIFNDDDKVIDFLSDLENRSVIRQLDKAMQGDKEIRGAFMDYHTEERIVTLLLFNDPFGYNENGNMLMLFIHPDVRVILEYFIKWMKQKDYANKNKRLALKDIILLLNAFKEQMEARYTQTNQMG